MDDLSPIVRSPGSPAVSSTSPNRFRRVGKRGFKCKLPRTFRGYFADTRTAVLGAATKYILRTDRPSDPQYIVKYAQKHGNRETLTEFFINRFGALLALNIAHSGLLVSDDQLTFATRVFLGEDESLRHGSLIIEDCFKREMALDSKELEKIHPRTEQEFYSIDFVTSVLREFCGKDFEAVFPPFIEMLVFDALIGSMDRHSQNWGVVAKSSGPVTYRFSPIFDTARALLWSLNEDQIERMCGEDEKTPPSFHPIKQGCKGMSTTPSPAWGLNEITQKSINAITSTSCKICSSYIRSPLLPRCRRSRLAWKISAPDCCGNFHFREGLQESGNASY